MVKTLRQLGIGFALIVAAAVSAHQAAAQPRIEVPISQTVQSNGMVRYSIPVTIGGQPVEAMLDTGSFGLRVLSRAVPSGAYEATAETRHFRYTSGARFNGNLARAVVGIGGASTGQPIPIQVVDSVDCSENHPECPASRVSPEDYRIAGTGVAGEGFAVIIGTSMRKSGRAFSADNPLSYLGQRWIIVLPARGSAASGRLVINPNPSEVGRFKRVQLSRQRSPEEAGATPGWKDDSVNGERLDSGGGPRLIAPFQAHAVFYDQRRGQIGYGPRN